MIQSTSRASHWVGVILGVAVLGSVIFYLTSTFRNPPLGWDNAITWAEKDYLKPLFGTSLKAQSLEWDICHQNPDMVERDGSQVILHWRELDFADGTYQLYWKTPEDFVEKRDLLYEGQYGVEQTIENPLMPGIYEYVLHHQNPRKKSCTFVLGAFEL